MTEEQQRLESKLKEAALTLSKSKPGDSGVEAAYSSAYQALVRGGYRQQLKRKYR